MQSYVLVSVAKQALKGVIQWLNFVYGHSSIELVDFSGDVHDGLAQIPVEGRNALV